MPQLKELRNRDVEEVLSRTPYKRMFLGNTLVLISLVASTLLLNSFSIKTYQTIPIKIVQIDNKNQLIITAYSANSLRNNQSVKILLDSEAEDSIELEGMIYSFDYSKFGEPYIKVHVSNGIEALQLGMLGMAEITTSETTFIRILLDNIFNNYKLT